MTFGLILQSGVSHPNCRPSRSKQVADKSPRKDGQIAMLQQSERGYVGSELQVDLT